jgi:hypothetical protein
MSDWNEEIPKFKAKRLGQIEVRPQKSKRRKPKVSKDFKVMTISYFNKELTMHRSATRAEAEAWIAKERRNYFHQAHAPESVNEARKKKHEERVDKYWIREPAKI